MAGELSLIVALFATSSKHVVALPAEMTRVVLLEPAPPPPPPPAPAKAQVTPRRTAPRKFDLAKLTAPVRIPVLPVATEAALPQAPEIAGLVGGVPGGVLGGIPGGVLGGVLSALPQLPPPPPPPAARPASAPPSRISVGGKVQEGLLLHEVMPPYPKLARSARITGAVRMKALIGCDGKVKELTLISGHPLLIAAAETAVWQWIYKPTLLNGLPVEVETEITVNFHLG